MLKSYTATVGYMSPTAVGNTQISQSIQSLREAVLKDTTGEAIRQARKTAIKMAHAIKDAIVDSAKVHCPIGAPLIEELKIEKRFGWGSGVNVDFTKDNSAEFAMHINPHKHANIDAVGHNQAWAILVSNDGRRKVVPVNAKVLAIPTKDASLASRKKGAPVVHRSDPSWYVTFARESKAVKGSHWIESAVARATNKVKGYLQ